MFNFYEGHKVYMNGKYPAIYLNGKSVHVHRLELLTRGKHVIEHQHNLHNETTHRFGEKSRRHKLTQTDVDYIKTNYKRYDKQFGSKALSKKFNVTPACICAVVSGTNWWV